MLSIECSFIGGGWGGGTTFDDDQEFRVLIRLIKSTWR